ncbi:hypothetical protein V5799_017557 [Amblyomma americanum]|uniref:Uncharacterized protein n=1 Tax=Amblyomma americanum TaxID=6943 RepID=A0AAQ4F2E8_AMBAM
MTDSPTSKKPFLPFSQTSSKFNNDAFQRELQELRVSRLHAYPSTIFARGGLIPTMPSRNSITITGHSISRSSLFEAATSLCDADNVRAVQAMSPEHMEPAPKTPEPRPGQTSPCAKDDTKTTKTPEP